MKYRIVETPGGEYRYRVDEYRVMFFGLYKGWVRVRSLKNDSLDSIKYSLSYYIRSKKPNNTITHFNSNGEEVHPLLYTWGYYSDEL